MINTLKNLENELKIRGFSQKTIDAYLLQNRLFLDYIKKDPNQITEDDIKSYMAHLMTNKKQKPASISQMLSALRFYYHIILKKAILADIKTPKLEKKLPTVLTKDEVSRLLKGLKNPKHRLLMELMISSGLRVSEACSLI